MCIPVPFYHCFGCVMGITLRGGAWRSHCHAGGVFQRRGNAEPWSLSALRPFTACRPCSSPSWTTRASPSLISLAAHRHHGRQPLPDRGHAEIIHQMGIRDITIGYGQTEASPSSRRPAPPTRWNCGSKPSAGPFPAWRSNCRSAYGCECWATSRANSAPGTRGHAGLLQESAATHGGSTGMAGCIPATWPSPADGCYKSPDD